MKVLVIGDNIQPHSGAGRYSLATLSQYPSLGAEPMIVTLKNKGKFKNELNILLSLTSPVNFFRNVFLIRKLAKNFKTVHAFDVWPYGVYGYFAVIATRKKLFMNGVGTYSVAPKTFSLKRLLMNLAFRRAERVYCISDYTEKRIKESSPWARTKVVYLGLTKMSDADASYLEKVAEKYDLKAHWPVIITVGQIKHRKGQFDTLAALNLIKVQFPNFLYLMVGSDTDCVYVDQIKKFAEENNLQSQIKIITGADDKELAALYKISNVLCLNSNNDRDHFEGFGLVFLEAAQFGLPGVGSSDCGIESALLDGHSGYLAEQGNPKDIAEKIKKVLDPENNEKLGRQAKEFASRFNYKKTAERFTEEYE